MVVDLESDDIEGSYYRTHAEADWTDMSDPYETTIEKLRANYTAGKFDPKSWNWCVSEELNLKSDNSFEWEWSVWIMGEGSGQCYAMIWCADEADARAICREFGILNPYEGVA